MTKAVLVKSPERQMTDYIKGKCIVQAILLLLGVILFLTADYLAFTYKALTVPLSGGMVLGSIPYAGSILFSFYGKTMEIFLPIGTIVVAVLCVLVPLGCLGYSIYKAFKEKKDNKLSGYILAGFGAALLLFYLLMLTQKGISAETPDGEMVTFYRLYEVKASFLIFSLLMLMAGAVQVFLRPELIERIKRYAFFYVVLTIPTLLILVFNVYPSLLQTILAFKDYKLSDGVWGSVWNGIENFKYIFTDEKMLMVIWQTVYLSVLRLIAGIVPPVFFALVFYHITSKHCKSVIQTIVYIPHFFSWVVIYAIFTNFFMPEGVINNVLVNVMHKEKIDFLSKQELFYPNMIFSSIWKEVGWGTILFTASLMGVDKTLYEAASLDGAGVFAKLRKITLPALVPILVYQIIMSIGNILKGAGGEQILIFATSAVRENKALVIDTWLYWEGLKEIKYGLSAAISFVQAVIGFFMVIGAHKLSQRAVGIGAW